MKRSTVSVRGRQEGSSSRIRGDSGGDQKREFRVREGKVV